MGKIVQVKTSTVEVRLPPLNLPYMAGEITTLTDKEYLGLSVSTKAAIVIIQSGVADPVRSSMSVKPSTATDAYKLAKAYTDEAIRALTTLGLNPPAEMATDTELATTLNTAKAYTDTARTALNASLTAETAARVAGDQATQASITDAVSQALTSAVAALDLGTASNQDVEAFDPAGAAQAVIDMLDDYVTNTALSAANYATLSNVAASISSALSTLDAPTHAEVTNSITTAINNLGLGTASTHPATDFATPASVTTATGTALTAAQTYADNAVASEATARTSAVSAAQAAAIQRANHTGTQLSTTISDFTEAVQDAVAALLTQGTGVTLSYNDAGNTLTITSTGGGGVTDPEVVRDTIGAALVGVAPISVVLNDAADTITISTAATQNQTDSYLLDRTHHTGTQLASTISDLTETVQDTVASELVAGSNVTLTYDDTAGTIVIDSTGGGGGGGGGEQLDYAYDISGGVTVIPTTGSAIDIAGGLGISCPATGTGRSLIIRWGGSCQITTAGAGLIGLNVYETTTGTAVQIGTSAICGSFTVGSGSAFPTFGQVSYDLGPTTTERQFVLRASMIRDASSTLAASVRSSTTGVVRAWVEGVAM